MKGGAGFDPRTKVLHATKVMATLHHFIHSTNSACSEILPTLQETSQWPLGKKILRKIKFCSEPYLLATLYIRMTHGNQWGVVVIGALAIKYFCSTREFSSMT